jgi:DMSO/TMAO reductase YedYZ molybdopterin-dependent catalytic subunit
MNCEMANYVDIRGMDANGNGSKGKRTSYDANFEVIAVMHEKELKILRMGGNNLTEENV